MAQQRSQVLRSLLAVSFGGLLGRPAWAEGDVCVASGDTGACGGRSGQRLAIVTGASRGIGLDVVSGLLSRLPADFDVILTGRQVSMIDAAVRCLRQRHYGEGEGNTCCTGHNAGQQPCEFGSWYYKAEGAGAQDAPGGGARLRSFRLDLTDERSILDFGEHVRQAYGRVDILVNNGAAPSRAGPEQHVNVDHFGHLALHQQLRPLLQPGARIVHVGSDMGALRNFGAELRQRFLDPRLSQSALDDLLREYLAAAREGRQSAQGWPGGSGYSVAKAANAATARIQAREVRELGVGADVLVNACCPGPANAPHTQRGAHVVLFLALLPPGDGRTGRWFVDRGWTGQPWEVDP